MAWAGFFRGEASPNTIISYLRKYVNPPSCSAGFFSLQSLNSYLHKYVKPHNCAKSAFCAVAGRSPADLEKTLIYILVYIECPDKMSYQTGQNVLPDRTQNVLPDTQAEGAGAEARGGPLWGGPATEPPRPPPIGSRRFPAVGSAALSGTTRPPTICAPLQLQMVGGRNAKR